MQSHQTGDSSSTKQPNQPIVRTVQPARLSTNLIRFFRRWWRRSSPSLFLCLLFKCYW